MSETNVLCFFPLMLTHNVSPLCVKEKLKQKFILSLTLNLKIAKANIRYTSLGGTISYAWSGGMNSIMKQILRTE